MTTYKITYEHSSNGETQTEDTLLECDHESTREELEHAVSWDTLRFHRHGLATWAIISVVPLE
ncbi:UNVERIFIED_ORG: hypothetical protein QE398_000108 [Atlantibacter sp. SORGH_AS 304]|nr:hypothetical protein [Atlantibacter sp. SORGH_AS_0304]